MNAPQTYDAGFSRQIGRYSDAIQVPADYDQIVVSGTPDLDENGNIPADFADEARAGEERFLSVAARAASAARSAWTPGRGNNCNRGWRYARRCPWALCSA
jgi:hypothetical protein